MTAGPDAGRPQPQPQGTARRTLPSVLLLAGLVGMVGAGAVQSAHRTTPPVPAPRVAVTAALRTALLDPVPTGVLDVTVDNRDSVPVTVREVQASGAGVAGTMRAPSGRGLAPGATTTFEVRVPLRCTATDPAAGPAPGASAGSGSGTGPPDVAVTVTALGRADGAVPAVAGGRALAEGLCATATAVLPAGWTRPAVSRGFRAEGDRATVLLTGLPSGTAEVLAVHAGPLALAVPASRVDPDGTGSITLAPPTADCRTLTAGSALPAGLAVLTRGSASRPVEVYVPVGADLSRWLLASWRAACPERAEFVGATGASGAAAEPPTGIDIHATD